LVVISWDAALGKSLAGQHSIPVTVPGGGDYNQVVSQCNNLRNYQFTGQRIFFAYAELNFASASGDQDRIPRYLGHLTTMD